MSEPCYLLNSGPPDCVASESLHDRKCDPVSGGPSGIAAVPDNFVGARKPPDPGLHDGVHFDLRTGGLLCRYGALRALLTPAVPSRVRDGARQGIPDVHRRHHARRIARAATRGDLRGRDVDGELDTQLPSDRFGSRHAWASGADLGIGPTGSVGDSGVRVPSHGAVAEGQLLGTVLIAQGKIRNFFGGSLMGVFLLGMLSRRANASGALWSIVVSFAATALLAGGTDVSWTWYSVFSAAVSFVVRVCVSRASAAPNSDRLDGLVWKGNDG